VVLASGVGGLVGEGVGVGMTVGVGDGAGVPTGIGVVLVGVGVATGEAVPTGPVGKSSVMSLVQAARATAERKRPAPGASLRMPVLLDLEIT
jgi:hypothetical protein